MAWSLVGFTILVTGVSAVASTVALIIGIFVWLGFVYVLRWTTWVDRRLAGWQRGQPVPAVYRRADTVGIVPTLRAVSRDRQTWRDLSWLGVSWIVGFTLGVAVITAAGIVGTYVSMPIWYWAVSSPESQHGVTNLGLYTVDTLGEALITMGIGLALAPLVLQLARWIAAAHAGLAARYLSSAPQATVCFDRQDASRYRMVGVSAGPSTAPRSRITRARSTSTGAYPNDDDARGLAPVRRQR